MPTFNQLLERDVKQQKEISLTCFAKGMNTLRKRSIDQNSPQKEEYAPLLKP